MKFYAITLTSEIQGTDLKFSRVQADDADDACKKAMGMTAEPWQWVIRSVELI